MNNPEEILFLKENYEAEKHFKNYGDNDPFPNIPPALLNSADIYDYVCATGMICPFDKAKLKSASYEISFLGDLHYKDDLGKYKVIPVEKGKPYELGKNSITFLFLKTTFRLPDYIAARFNLHISLVHAGLLLGTGPLIDPGYAGQLLIPLHNLTSDILTIKGGDGLIWVEFTKLSPNRSWNPKTCLIQEGEYIPFPEKKRYQSAEKFFQKASCPGASYPARSSIPIEITKARRSETRAWKLIQAVSAIGIVGILALGYSVYSLVSDANNNVANAFKAISDYRDYQNEIKRRLDDLDAQVKGLVANQPKQNIQDSTSPPQIERNASGNIRNKHKD